ncbi:MAG TPA: GTP cyclohydrolase I FolE [Spirochaetia bacterium]|nr:GTP cyclohydrolase I FolE [Spirochaetia bacterium]
MNENSIREFLSAAGEDPSREGLLRTPERVRKSWEFLLSGYRQSIDEIINGAVFTENCNDMIISKDIEIYSMCEHHMLPFFGKCHIGYIPKGKVFGISKLSRIVDLFSRRLQLQERLTAEIAETIMNIIEPDGVGVVIEAQHLCMMMRGVQKQNSVMVTSSMKGIFMKNSATRTEFLNLVGLHKQNR